MSTKIVKNMMNKYVQQKSLTQIVHKYLKQKFNSYLSTRVEEKYIYNSSQQQMFSKIIG